MINTFYVFAYVNPDTDGICSSIAYSFFKQLTVGQNFVPVVFGSLSTESLFVLNYFNVTMPIINPMIPLESKIILLDTHHINQLPTNISLQNVIEIIDHHPVGNPEAFPNAIIQNELIGAVATLVTEKFQAHVIEPDNKIASLLTAAIISNTLNFSAPSTSNRDRKALEWLKKFTHIPSNFIQELFNSWVEEEQKCTKDILISDYKKFIIGGIKFSICQIESLNSENIISRTDLLSSLSEIKIELNVDHVFLNIIDLIKKASVIVTPELETQEILIKAIKADFRNSIAQFNQIMLRKTDLLPQLQALFMNT